MVSIVNAARNTERLARIATVLIKHGFGELVSRLPGLSRPTAAAAGDERKTFAVRLREVLEELGPSFVKLGQIVSTRPDLIPADVIAELARLQDRVPPMKPEEIEEIVAESWPEVADGGAGLDAVFASFDRTPLASASIGQVHPARLRRAAAGADAPEVTVADDGDADLDVVVKLQRPTARAVVERDLELLYMFARLVERYVPESRVYAPLALVREFDRAITAELDYGLEADNARRFAKNFDGWTTVRFPVPYREASGKRALVMERLRGARLEDFVAGNDAGPRIARQALAVIAKMIFEDGFFHADPHPGNIIMLGTPAAPVVGLIDLGLVGQLTAETRDRMIDVMISAVTGDTGALADGLLAMGTARRQVDRNAFRSEVATLAGKYLGRPLAEIELSAVIRDLVQGAVKYDIEMPPEMLMVGKALMTVEGIGRQLDPDLDVWAELQPILTRIVRDRYSPQRIGRDLLRAARQLGTSATALPGQITDVLDDLRAGQLTVVSRDPGLAAATDRLGRRLFTAILVAALVGAGTALLIADRHGTTAVGLLVTAAALLALHVVGDRRRDRQRPG